jgi:ribonuclease BN (tRNA processing enzyme)
MKTLASTLIALFSKLTVDVHAGKATLQCDLASGPALDYKIRIGQQSIVFAGDQNGSSDTISGFAKGADILVMHMAVPENITGAGRNLHTPPSVIGKIASQTDTKMQVVSHFMARSLYNIEKNLNTIRNNYSGKVISARDLDCVGF